MADSKAKIDATEAELAVLQELWNDPGATIRQLTDRLYPNGGQAHYATVQKLLERLEEKGFVARDASDSPHRFRAVVARDELIGRRLRAMADKLCGGSLTPLLTNLVQSQSLTTAQVRELRELIDKLDRKRKRKS